MNKLWLWWRYSELRYWGERLKADFLWWVACRVPRKIAYLCAIRVGVHATTGPWSKCEAPTVTIAEMLKRWNVETPDKELPS